MVVACTKEAIVMVEGGAAEAQETDVIDALMFAHKAAQPILELVEKMRAALKAAGKPSEIHLYPDMPPGFHADYRPSYRKEAAQDGWKRLLDWFKKHGVA